MIENNLFEPSAEEKLKHIIGYYGIESQLDKLVEECGEYIAARTKENVKIKFKTFQPKDRTHMLEEFADVLVLVNQVLLAIGESERKTICEIANEKINRQIVRIIKGTV